jgi:excisionase family DNA binding protein
MNPNHHDERRRRVLPRPIRPPRFWMFTIRQVAERHGVSERTVRRWISRNGLRVHHNRDGSIQISEPDLGLFFLERSLDYDRDPWGVATKR